MIFQARPCTACEKSGLECKVNPSATTICSPCKVKHATCSMSIHWDKPPEGSSSDATFIRTKWARHIACVYHSNQLATKNAGGTPALQPARVPTIYASAIARMWKLKPKDRYIINSRNYQTIANTTPRAGRRPGPKAIAPPSGGGTKRSPRLAAAAAKNTATRK